MNIGDQPAFPRPSSGPGQGHSQSGMTYRQWLVGQIAAGAMTNPCSWGHTPEFITRITFVQVNEIIERMEKEGK